MFTGIIEELGTIAALRKETGRVFLTVRSEICTQGTQKGDSIAIDGVCQTVEEVGNNTFSVWTLAESLKKTTLGSLRPGSPVNLERALPVGGRLGGHFVQGHVSAAVSIRELRKTPGNVYLSVEVPPDLRRYCVREGSVALDGISLTVARIEAGIVTVNVIPATFERTTLNTKRSGSLMNFEADLLARYMEGLLGKGAENGANTGLSAARMSELGY